jgi:hypothetical protein
MNEGETRTRSQAQAEVNRAVQRWIILRCEVQPKTDKILEGDRSRKAREQAEQTGEEEVEVRGRTSMKQDMLEPLSIYQTIVVSRPHTLAVHFPSSTAEETHLIIRSPDVVTV